MRHKRKYDLGQATSYYEHDLLLYGVHSLQDTDRKGKIGESLFKLPRVTHSGMEAHWFSSEKRTNIRRDTIKPKKNIMKLTVLY